MLSRGNGDIKNYGQTLVHSWSLLFTLFAFFVQGTSQTAILIQWYANLIVCLGNVVSKGGTHVHQHSI